MNVLGLLVAERQAVSTKAKLDRITQGRPADHFDAGTIAETHLKQASANFRIAPNGYDASAATNAQLVEATAAWVATMVTASEITCLLHRIALPSPRLLKVMATLYRIETEFQHPFECRLNGLGKTFCIQQG